MENKVKFDSVLDSWAKRNGEEYFFVASRTEFHRVFNRLIKAGIPYERLVKPEPLTKEINVNGHNYLMREEFLTNPSKPIDKVIAKDNLILFDSVLQKHSLPFFLAFGTLLGAIREADFIAHDSDTDIGMYLADKNKFLPLIFELHQVGLNLVRFDENLLSFMRQGEYIDVYFFEKKWFPKDGWYCGRLFMPAKFLHRLDSCEFHQKKFLTPWQPEKYLAYCYGKSWKTPVKDKHAKPMLSIKSLLAQIFPLKVKLFLKRLFMHQNL